MAQSRYDDLNVGNIRLLASTIYKSGHYSERTHELALAVIEECDAYEPGDGSAFDGLMLNATVQALVRHIPGDGFAIELAQQIN